MGFDDMLKEGEQALDGQTSADQQAASGQSGGHESMEDTAVDSGKNSVRNQLWSDQDANVVCSIQSLTRSPAKRACLLPSTPRSTTLSMMRSTSSK
jgi:hypothetical protein